ncbi:hypothetical protein SAMN02745249_01529 [Atopostipes suicloacalis DSM 15692]|uniref:Uncharacterized protein n=2 Tax=Atopostipes suicloacalis TaxID=180295 RepID=A0A1M4XTI8_9LACT|nr:hypothetical protein SAMN02745249_01529 [Atopostipes suicloacalis DSM 15692]
MRKKMSKLLIASSLSLVLAACGNTDSGDEDLTPETDQTEDTETAEDTDTVEETEDTEESEENESDTDSEEASDEDVSDDDMASADEEELESAENVSDHEEYEELSAQDFFNPDDYTSHLVVDNPGKRIFVFEDDGQQAYKTIYIKKTNRLKIIDLKNDGLLMNEIID